MEQQQESRWLNVLLMALAVLVMGLTLYQLVELTNGWLAAGKQPCPLRPYLWRDNNAPPFRR